MEGMGRKGKEGRALLLREERDGEEMGRKERRDN